MERSLDIVSWIAAVWPARLRFTTFKVCVPGGGESSGISQVPSDLTVHVTESTSAHSRRKVSPGLAVPPSVRRAPSIWAPSSRLPILIGWIGLRETIIVFAGRSSAPRECEVFARPTLIFPAVFFCRSIPTNATKSGAQPMGLQGQWYANVVEPLNQSRDTDIGRHQARNHQQAYEYR